MNNQLLLLTSIHDRIDQISFPQKNYYLHAKFLCNCMFQNIIKDGSDFKTPKEFHSNYFKKLIKNCPTRCTILKELKLAGILIDTSYSTGLPAKDGKKEVLPYCKNYSFGTEFIYNSPILFSQFKNINKTDDRIKFHQLNETLKTVHIDTEVFDFIPVLIEKELKKIIIGKEITNKMITMKMGKIEKKEPLCYWLAVATRNNVALIKFKKRFYIEGVKSFIERKRIELEIMYTHSIEQIINGNFYANRNETNNRLDYNMTGLKKKLFPFLYLDGELTEELDIKNAQFAILSNIPTFKLDEKFIEVAQSGQLYEFIGSKFDMTRDQVKEYLIVVAFGEVEHHQKALNELFPTTMKSISDFKNKFGYENFSVMLQKAESNLMIDGVYKLLYDNNIKTLPIHDSVRVKASDAVMVKRMMENFFIEKEFKCALKNK